MAPVASSLTASTDMASRTLQAGCVGSALAVSPAGPAASRLARARMRDCLPSAAERADQPPLGRSLDAGLFIGMRSHCESEWPLELQTE